MPKSNKKVKIKKRIYKKKTQNHKIKVLLVLFGFIFIIVAVNIYAAGKISSPKFEKHLITRQMDLKVKNLITPYPSITPKTLPTDVPLAGFCLYVPVLMYHHVQPKSVAKQLGQTALTVDSSIFDEQMQYLASQGYTTLFANELIDALINKKQLPKKSVVITIDDGYEDNYIYAFPSLKKYNLKANIMLASGLVNNSNMLSWDQVKTLKSSGLIYFTNHTWSHYPVTKQPQSKIETEIDIAQKQIQEYTGQIVNVFTYPYGHLNNNAIETLTRKGYIGAFSGIPGKYQCDSFLMTLHRTRIGNGSLQGYGL